jgi:hypothetical protein
MALGHISLSACFTLNFVLIYAVLAHDLRWNHSSQNPRTIGCTRFHAVILGPVYCYKTDIGFTLNFVLMYAVLDHVLRWNSPEPEPGTIDCTRFSRHNFGPRLLLQNKYRIYAKFRTHLRCFSSRFTLESARARTCARSAARDFHAVILGPVCCYKTEIRFTLNFVLIYAVLAHVLRWNPPEPEPMHDRLHAIFTP